MKKITFIVAYDKVYGSVISKLKSTEDIYIYSVNKEVKKNFTKKLPVINEFDLPNYFPYFQKKQYYEYSILIHLLHNQHLIEDYDLIGILHYDIEFNRPSLTDIDSSDAIYYQTLNSYQNLHMNDIQVEYLLNYLNKNFNLNLNLDQIKHKGWVSECMSYTPKKLLLNFAHFLYQKHKEIENILINNEVDMNTSSTYTHRMCGFVERLWGLYLMGHQLPLKKLDIRHDWSSYKHAHHQDINLILRPIKNVFLSSMDDNDQYLMDPGKWNLEYLDDGYEFSLVTDGDFKEVLSKNSWYIIIQDVHDKMAKTEKLSLRIADKVYFTHIGKFNPIQIL